MPLGTVRRGVMDRFFGPHSAERARVEISVTTQCEVEADSDSTFDIKPDAHQLAPEEVKSADDKERMSV